MNCTNCTWSVNEQFWEYFDDGRSISGAENVALEAVRGGGEQLVLWTYGLLMLVGAAGNVAVLGTLVSSRRRRSRVNLLMTHLALADVCVTCAVIPLEMGWKYTNAWLAGNLLCKLLLVLRAFGLYLSSNVLVCISVDRFFAVLYPLRLSVARRKSKQMLCAAWVAALACSLPQSAIFRVLPHPRVVGFEQCVSFDAFSSARLELAYNVFCLCAMYFVPLLLISACYLAIFCHIQSTTREASEQCVYNTKKMRLRRSQQAVLARARRRTLRMTVVIVSVFALCWLPYATMAMWYMVDRESAERVSPEVQDLLFAMAVSNSCMNPLVYGSYVLRLNVIPRFFKYRCCWSTAASDTLGQTQDRSSSTKNRNNRDMALVATDPSRPVRPRLVRFVETPVTVPERVEPRNRPPA